MSERYTARFEIRGPQQELFARVSETALRWVWRRFPAEPPAAAGEGDWSENGQRLRIRCGSADHLAFFTFVWTLPDPQRPKDTWTVEARFSTEGESVEAEVRLGLEAQGERSGAQPVGLISEMLDEFDCFAGETRLESKPMAVDEQAVESFVDQLLRSDERGLPVIVVSKRSGELLTDPNDLQRRLAARALVAVVEEDATRLMSDRLGRGMACYGGAVRIYQPRLAESDSPRLHRFWLPGAVRNSNDKFINELLVQVALNAAESSAVGDFDDVRARVLRAERRTATASLAHGAEDVEALYELLDEEAKRREEAETERDEQRRLAIQFERLVDMQVARAEELEQELSELRDGAGIQVKNVREAVSRAQKQFSGLRFFKSAVKSSEQVQGFPRPQEVYQALQTLHSLSGELHRNSGVRRAQWLKERGVDFAEHESQSTMGKFKGERTFLDDERDAHVEMQSHIKLGGGFGGAGTLRIHVAWDESEERWLVGHVGRHLRTASG